MGSIAQEITRDAALHERRTELEIGAAARRLVQQPVEVPAPPERALAVAGKHVLAVQQETEE